MTSEEVSTVASKDRYTKLIWEDNFDGSGKVDSNKWQYEVRNQWYNNEKQATTDRLDNVKVENGVLKNNRKKRKLWR